MVEIGDLYRRTVLAIDRDVVAIDHRLEIGAELEARIAKAASELRACVLEIGMRRLQLGPAANMLLEDLPGCLRADFDEAAARAGLAAQRAERDRP